MTDVALTLADYAAMPSKLVAGVAKVLRENSVFMDVLPFKDVGALAVEVNRETGMNNVAWRRIGNAHGSTKAPKPEKVMEQAFSIGNNITVDKVYMKDRTPRLYDPMTHQTVTTTKSIARNFTDKAINGIPADIDNPVGLAYRVMNDSPSSQRLDAGGVDISSDASTLSTNIQTYIDKLDALLYAVNDNPVGDGSGVYFLTNDTVLLRTQSCFRQSGILSTTQDSLGRIFTTYKGAKFIDMGFKYDEATRIMLNTELANGTASTGATFSSIYAVRLGDDAFTGWQEYALEVTPPVLDPADNVTYRSTIDWVVGLAVSHPRSIARLYDIQAA